MENNFDNFSIRLRSYYCIKALEILISRVECNPKEYDFILNILKEKISCEKLGGWHYPFSELNPFSICNDVYRSVDYEHIDEITFKRIKSIYSSSSKDVLKTIDDLFEISTRDLYSSIINKSQYTLAKLKNVVERLKFNDCNIPVVVNIKGLTINDNNGWGDNISYFDVEFI